MTKEELEVLTELTQIGHMTFVRELANHHPRSYIMSYEGNEEELEEEEFEELEEELEEEFDVEEPDAEDPRIESEDGDLYPEDIKRKERQVNPVSTPSFTDQAIILALTYENSCSPVLQASAMSIIECLEE